MESKRKDAARVGWLKTGFTRKGERTQTTTVVVKLITNAAATRAETLPPASAIAMAVPVPQTAPEVWATATFRKSIARFKTAVGTTPRAPKKNETERNCRILATCGSWKKRAAGQDKATTNSDTTTPVPQLSQNAVEANLSGNSRSRISAVLSRRHEWFPADSSPGQPYPLVRKQPEGFVAPVPIPK